MVVDQLTNCDHEQLDIISPIVANLEQVVQGLLDIVLEDLNSSLGDSIKRTEDDACNSRLKQRWLLSLFLILGVGLFQARDRLLEDILQNLIVEVILKNLNSKLDDEGSL